MSKAFWNWFKYRRALQQRQLYDNDTVEHKLSTRCNIEIAARLVRRAEIHDEQGDYLSRCSPLDRIAAQRIRDLENRLALAEGRDAEEPQLRFHRMLGSLQEP